MFLYLILAAFWLIAAIMIFSRGGNTAIGCLFLLVVVYNVGRWWNRRSYAASIAKLRQTEDRLKPQSEPNPLRVPDPLFDFSNSSPENGGAHDDENAPK